MPGNLLDDGIVLARWRHAFALLRSGAPSAFEQLRALTERMHAGMDIQMPMPGRPGTAATTPSAPRGRPPVHDWAFIARFVAEFRRTHDHATWKQCLAALTEVLDKVPHIETLKSKLRSL